MSDHVFISGPASWNQIVYLDHLPEPRPHMQFATSHVETVGGTSAGKALNLAAAGVPVVLHTILGTDDAGAHVASLLEGVGVELIAERRGTTERHLNLMTPAGERVSLYLDTADAAGDVDPRVAASLATASAAVLDLSERSRALLPDAVRSGAEIWTDLHDYDGASDFHAPFAAAAARIFLNADGTDDHRALMQRLLANGATTVVCTLGAAGAVALDAEGWHEVEATPVEVVDTNGAGDAFFAGFLIATLRGAPLDEALSAASVSAAAALTTHHLHPSLA